MKVWTQILNELAGQYGLTEQEWNSYSLKAGWALRLKQKKRNIVYLSPRTGSFQIAFILGDKAVEAAGKSKLSKAMKQNIARSKRYPEGTAVRLEVKSPKDVAAIVTLAGIKLAH